MLHHQNLRLRVRIGLGSDMCVLALGFNPWANGQSDNAVRNEFRNSPRKFRPMVHWWWPGGDLADEEIKREVGILDSYGFAGAGIQPSNTLVFTPNLLSKEKMERVNDYATPTFFKHVQAADAAASHGMWIDDTRDAQSVWQPAACGPTEEADGTARGTASQGKRSLCIPRTTLSPGISGPCRARVVRHAMATSGLEDAEGEAR